jgi:hypothetical protein
VFEVVDLNLQEQVLSLEFHRAIVCSRTCIRHILWSGNHRISEFGLNPMRTVLGDGLIVQCAYERQLVEVCLP